MNRILFIFVLTTFSVSQIFAQDLSEKTLLTINGEEVKVSEFIKVYEKNLDLVQDPEQKKIDNYFPLFTSYKAKLMQAHKLGLDTMNSYTKELAGYRKDLATPYFKDPKEEQKLLKEAWERSKIELNVSHILLLVPEDANSTDTLKAYKKLLSIRKEIEIGKISFNDAAKKYSEDPSAKKNKGNLNWMSVFYMVYPFETGAYNTSVGDVSFPIRSSFGYHLIKVNEKRASKGKVQIAHIIKMNAPGAKKDSVNKTNLVLMDTIYSQLQSGKEFAMLARKYSDDMRSGMNGGVLPVLGVGKMMPDMENRAFSLNEGEFSKPFKTKYGWHIIKVLKKLPIKSFEESKESLANELSKDNRSKFIEKSVINHLYEKYSVKLNNKLFSKIEKNIDSSYFNKGWRYNDTISDKSIFSIEDHKIYEKEYINFLEKNQSDKRKKYSLDYILSQKRKQFVDEKLLEYYDNNLEKNYQKFKSIMDNYREGILIYNLMNLKIWEKSNTDTTGLALFYENNKANYMWEERADLVIAKCFNEEDAKRVRKYIKRGKSKEKIEKKLNKDSQVAVIFQSGIVTSKNDILPNDFVWKKGISKIYKKSDTNYVTINVKQFVKPQIKTLKETKNRVISDYQVFLENEWTKELINNYKIVLDKEVYLELKKKYEQF